MTQARHARVRFATQDVLGRAPNIRVRLAIVAVALVVAACPPRAPTRTPLRVGANGDYPPFSAGHGAERSGLDIDVVHRFARDTGRSVTIVPFRWPDLLADLRAGRFDVAVGGVTIRPERAVVGTFTRPVVRAGAIVLAPPGLPALDAPDVRLAVNAGGHLERLARRLFPAAALVTTTDNRLVDLLVAGDADAIVTDEIEADHLASERPALGRRGPYTRDAKAYLAADPALARELDAWLRAREGDGTLAALRARWLGAARAARRSAADSDVDALAALIDLRFAFMPAVAAAKRAAGRPIDDPAQEARVLAAVEDWARPAGLAPEPVATLFHELIRAARAVQERFVRRPWPVDALDLDTEARPALARVSHEIVQRAAAVAQEHLILDESAVAEQLDPSWSDAPTRAAIARALVGLREQSACREPTFVKAEQLR